MRLLSDKITQKIKIQTIQVGKLKMSNIFFQALKDLQLQTSTVIK